MTQVPSLAITMGDPAGIGPEIILKALAQLSDLRSQLTVVGDRQLLEAIYNHLIINTALTKQELAHPETFPIIDIGHNSSQITPGQGNITSGKFSFACLDKAISLTLAGDFQGIVTAPIAKSLWIAAGHNYPGQTEVLATRARVARFGMMFVGQSPHTGWILRSLLATTHIPLMEVSHNLTPNLMDLKLGLLIDCLEQDFGISEPTIAIPGLNPHSGEAGQLGKEEQDWLYDWLESAQGQYPQIKLKGLIPPDTMWVAPGKAWYGDYNQMPDTADAYLALYHDQGLIPIKLMAFEQAINTTIGLPFIRTSPDHGTAFDIAGKGRANASSLKAAINLATQMAQQRLSLSNR